MVRSERSYNRLFLVSVSLVAALGGLLFGYDWVVIGGAKPFYEAYFALTDPADVGWAMSSALIGCLAGALGAGWTSDRWGRKKLLLAAAFMFAGTSIATGLAADFPWFVFFRLLGGVAIGLASVLSPLYIAEIVPAEIRGRFVSLNQLTIVIGILLAQVTNWLIAEPVAGGASQAAIAGTWNGQWGWRWMFGVTAIPSAAFFTLLFLVPESPRWLMKQRRDDAARRILERIGGSGYAASELERIASTVMERDAKVDLSVLLDRRMRRVLLIGMFLAAFQQWCGINVIFNFAQEIFAAAGFGVSDILFNIVVTGSVNLAFTFVAIGTVDRLGRRFLLVAGSAGLFLCHLLIGASYALGAGGIVVLLLTLLAIACYSCSLAPVVWVVLSEIFPNRIRGAAMSVAVFVLWTACFVLTYTFPLLNHTLGAAWTFWIYAAICLVGLLVIARTLPETKGRSLEQIEAEMVR
jgi:SP family sugar porter-like MFS transporter